MAQTICPTCGSPEREKNWRILTPSGVIADGYYSLPFPAKIPDRGYHYFDTDDAESYKCIDPWHSTPAAPETARKEAKNG